ncbi:MAG: hypothetical protein QXH03_00100 [Candidatus Bathyarchaeia archaeon]
MRWLKGKEGLETIEYIVVTVIVLAFTAVGVMALAQRLRDKFHEFAEGL